MSNVVPLKFKKPVTTDAARIAIEAEFVRMADAYGVHAVVTVATGLIAVAIETSIARGRPNETAWVEDLRACLQKALKGRSL